jgi:hypothetical protein
LPSLNTDEDINNTLASIAQAGFNTVRTWAFNGACRRLLITRISPYLRRR